MQGEYAAILKYLRKYFGTTPAVDVEEQEAAAFVKWFGEQGLASETIRIRLIIIKACWKWGIKARLVKSNP
ncbi:phage integrase SAM-like domain-containing protein [Anthocerotibacter panamensis]|uniref:phage integrase SAM-like domain-containing protein n=1 Tax=Anthocerotibacter panamensis TaxID=2857077 RepID=UPI001C40281F